LQDKNQPRQNYTAQRSLSEAENCRFIKLSRGSPGAEGIKHHYPLCATIQICDTLTALIRIDKRFPKLWVITHSQYRFSMLNPTRIHRKSIELPVF
jgi:hypothetical protein